MTEYWLISAPGDKTCQQTYDTMNNLTSKQNSLSENCKFHIPDLKVGTLDQLVGLSDDLGKLDTYVEQITRKVAAYLGEVLEDQRDKLHENLQANNCQTSMEETEESPQRSPDTPPNTPITPTFKPMGKDQHRHNWNELELPDSPEPPNFIGQQHQLQPPNRYSSESHSPPIDQSHSHAHHHCCHHHPHHHSQHNRHRHHQHQHQSQNHPHHHQQQQQQHQQHVLHHHHHGHNQDHHNPHDQHDAHGHRSHDHGHHHEKSLSLNPQDNLKSRGSHDSSMYSCYHPHWCASSSTTSTPSPENSPRSYSPSSYSYSPSSSCSSDEEHLDQKKSSKSMLRCSSSSKRRRNRCRPNCHHRAQSSLRCVSIRSRDVDSDDDPFDKSANKQDQASSSLPSPGDLPSYITRFQWDVAKYPIKQSLRNIADIICKQVSQIDADLKTKSTTYNNLKGSLQNLEKKQTGSLLTRNLADLVKKEHFILDSEYLTTLLVIVPRPSFQEWNTLYEKLTDMIVPRSSQLITQDQDYGLFTVTLFKKVIEEFKLHAREKKFIVRDFTYNEDELSAGKNEITKLITDKKKQFGPLVRWLKVNFSECFCAWIHVKALRVFVESVLRYGLPVNFQAILLRPHKKSTKRLRDVLNQLYAHLDSSATAGSSQAGNQDSVDIPGLGFGQNDYFPYVYYKINVDMVDSKV